jgi:hypothetical protein
MVEEFILYDTLSNEKLSLLLKLDLPENIRRYIFENYFAPNIIYEKKYELLLRQVKSSECQSLKCSTLKTMLVTTLDDLIFCKFICQRNSIFSKIYKQHYVENDKSFVRMNTIDSLTLSWLMYLYH